MDQVATDHTANVEVAAVDAGHPKMPMPSRPRGAAAPVVRARTQTAPPAPDRLPRLKARIVVALARKDQTAGELAQYSVRNVPAAERDQALAELLREGRITSYRKPHGARGLIVLTLYRLAKPAARAAKAG